MKKILAVLLSLVMAFTFMMPAFAVEEAGEVTQESSITDSFGGIIDSAEDIRDSFENEDYTGVASGVFAFIENLLKGVHDLVHGLSEMFDFDCPFCDDKAEVPSEPEEPEEPSEPEEIIGTVANTNDLSAALVAGGTYNVEESIATESFEVNADTKVNFNLGGNTVSGATIINKGDIAVNGGAVESAVAGIENTGNAVLTDVDMTAGSPANYAAISYEGSYTEYNNMNLVSAGGGIGATGGKTVFNSGSIAVNTTSTSGRYIFYVVGEGTELVINDGTFSFSKTLNQKRAYIYVGAGATVTVNGGNFGPASTRSGYTAGILGDGTVIIKGGTFGFNPSNWVADGYEAVKDGSVWNVIAKA